MKLYNVDESESKSCFLNKVKWIFLSIFFHYSIYKSVKAKLKNNLWNTIIQSQLNKTKIKKELYEPMLIVKLIVEV